MTWEEIYNRLDHIPEYAVHIAEIKVRGGGAFGGMRVHQLPSFDYFYKNCVLDRGGNYDFTFPRYKIERVLETNMKFPFKKWYEPCPQYVKVVTIYCYWMGTPFNYVSTTEIV